MATDEAQVETTAVADHESLEAEFSRLADEWRRDSQFLSSSTDMAMLWPYQRIISLGHAVVPLILKELQREPDHWFWALNVITDENPVAAEDRGQVKKMADAWLQWGRENGVAF